MKKQISITDAKYAGGYKIALKFSDGKEALVDFEHFITHSHHPDIQKYRNLDLFKSFRITYGDLEWNDYELAFPIYDLYKGRIEYLSANDTTERRSAFTMIELVFVIVVLGILAALAIPRMERDLRQEAADNILSAIRYTQHLALVDDKTDPFFKDSSGNNTWQKTLWSIRFWESSTDGGSYYVVGSDTNSGGDINKPESAIDPANGKYMYHHNTNSIQQNESPNVILGKKYGINSIDFQPIPSSGSGAGYCDGIKHMGFDNLGRPHVKFTSSSSPDYSSYMKSDCNLTFGFAGGEDNISIIITKETGYAYIDGQPDS